MSERDREIERGSGHIVWVYDLILNEIPIVCKREIPPNNSQSEQELLLLWTNANKNSH